MDAIDQIFGLDPSVRYVARYRAGDLALRQREGLAAASAADSDRYEELLVNPTLLTLVRQRGDIDCGGAGFVVVGYGHFLQLVIALNDGHVSVALEHGTDPLALVGRVRAICGE